jgi:hypothetical protein
MPQNPLNLNTLNPLNVLVPQQVDSQGALRSSNTPNLTKLNMTLPTVLKAAPGRIERVNVIVAGTTPGGVYDCLTTAAAATSNQIASIPPLSTAAIGSLVIGALAQVGITILPGAGQTLTATYE